MSGDTVFTGKAISYIVVKYSPNILKMIMATDDHVRLLTLSTIYTFMSGFADYSYYYNYYYYRYYCHYHTYISYI